MKYRRVMGVATALALLVPAGIAASASPAAAVGGTSCSKQVGTVTITPGLGTTKKAQTIVATTTISGCSGGGVTGGKGTATIKTAPSNCSGLAGTGMKSPINETIKWNNGKTSTLTGTSTTGPKVGQATIALKVTKGLFIGLKGSTVVSFKPAQPAPYCTDAKPLKKLTISGVKPFAIK